MLLGSDYVPVGKSKAPALAASSASSQIPCSRPLVDDNTMKQLTTITGRHGTDTDDYYKLLNSNARSAIYNYIYFRPSSAVVRIRAREV